jgi:pimeloyl-ACP methyl ester carboxylesterase
MRDLEPGAPTVSTQHLTRNTDFGARIADADHLQFRIHGDAGLPTLIHLPGLHGDWTLLGPFRAAIAGRARFVETTYPRRLDWSLEDYAAAVEAALLERGVNSGWVLGESFSSLVAWQLVARRQARNGVTAFAMNGLILVGGFVRHPWPWAVRFAHATSGLVSPRLLRYLCRWYGRAARRRFCECPEAVTELDEFVERRANEADRRALTQRYTLITQTDARLIASSAALAVYQLSGAWDPIVPWWHVRSWLRRCCPSLRASRIIWSGGHNVLLSAPRKSAEQIMEWVGGGAE